MWHKFKLFSEKYRLFQKGDQVLLAMSGGVDSMVLAHLLLRVGVDFKVAHCNYQLRGKESDADAAFVEQWCLANGVDCYLKSFQLQSAAAGRSVQEEARTVRYRWFSELLKQYQLDKLATAHHASDNTETLFINLLRGAGAKGWAGIPVSEQNLIRPLLFATKAELYAFAEQNSIEYRADKSNASDHYLRNRIRHHIVPEFSALQPDFESRVSANQMHLRQMVELTSVLIKQQNPNIFIEQDQQILIRHREIQPETFTETILFYWIQPFGFNAAQCSEILEAAHSGKRFLSATHELLVDREELHIRALENAGLETNAVEIFRGQQNIDFPVKLKFVEAEKDHFEIPADSASAALDISTLQFPLILRPWRTGDRFQPLGMKTQKLVSDFLIDEKVSRFEKEQQYVLESDGKIVWVVGRRIADWAKITSDTRQILFVSPL